MNIGTYNEVLEEEGWWNPRHGFEVGDIVIVEEVSEVSGKGIIREFDTPESERANIEMEDGLLLSCHLSRIEKTYKIQVSRIRKPYFDAIISGEKGEELKALSPYWIKRLLKPKIKPNIMKFICGKRVHSRKITRIFTEKAENILGRPVSEQGKKDLQLDEHDGYCIVVKLGEEVKA